MLNMAILLMRMRQGRRIRGRSSSAGIIFFICVIEYTGRDQVAASGVRARDKV
jgi:hypothetical protein